MKTCKPKFTFVYGCCSVSAIPVPSMRSIFNRFVITGDVPDETIRSYGVCFEDENYYDKVTRISNDLAIAESSETSPDDSPSSETDSSDVVSHLDSSKSD